MSRLLTTFKCREGVGNVFAFKSDGVADNVVLRSIFGVAVLHVVSHFVEDYLQKSFDQHGQLLPGTRSAMATNRAEALNCVR